MHHEIGQNVWTWAAWLTKFLPAEMTNMHWQGTDAPNYLELDLTRTGSEPATSRFHASDLPTELSSALVEVSNTVNSFVQRGVKSVSHVVYNIGNLFWKVGWHKLEGPPHTPSSTPGEDTICQTTIQCHSRKQRHQLTGGASFWGWLVILVET